MTKAFPIRIALSLERDVPEAAVHEALRVELRRWTREAEDDDAVGLVLKVGLRRGKIAFSLEALFEECAKLVHRFALRLARRINALLGRRGKVFRERYRILSRPYVHVPQPLAPLKQRVMEGLRETVEGLGYLAASSVGIVAGTVIARRHIW